MKDSDLRHNTRTCAGEGLSVEPCLHKHICTTRNALHWQPPQDHSVCMALISLTPFRLKKTCAFRKQSTVYPFPSLSPASLFVGFGLLNIRNKHAAWPPAAGPSPIYRISIACGPCWQEASYVTLSCALSLASALLNIQWRMKGATSSYLVAVEGLRRADAMCQGQAKRRGIHANGLKTWPAKKKRSGVDGWQNVPTQCPAPCVAQGKWRPTMRH